MHKQRHFLRNILSHRIWSVLLVVLSVILLFLGHGKDDSLRETRNIISTYTAPVLAALSKPFSLANEAVEDVTKLVSLKEEVDRLREENEKLRHLKTEASQKDIKLKQLQSFLNLKIDPHIQYLTARVIADLNSPYKESLRLNVGAQNRVP
jgi:cell shape-determining protein MreC